MFLPHEANVILGIPLSLRLPRDSLIWAWTPKGMFTVNSAYKVAQSLLREAYPKLERGECSHTAGMKNLWKQIWGLNCPNKVRIFMWRACSNILPTKLLLRARGIGRDDVCDLCGGSESSGHILWGCKVAREVWSNTRLKLPLLEVIPRDFVDIVWGFLERRPGMDWELFATTAWGLWNNRNKVRHGGRCKSPELIFHEAAAYLGEVKKLKNEKRRPENSHRQSWTPPKKGFYKINVDGAVFEELGCCGVGVVIRNEYGQLMGAMSKKYDLPLRALEVEARAMEEGIIFARELSLKKVILESDAQVVVKSLSKESMAPSSIIMVIEGANMSLRGFESWVVNHICRNKNSAAHIMAQDARFVSDVRVWVEDTPPMIEQQIMLDVSRLNVSIV